MSWASWDVPEAEIQQEQQQDGKARERAEELARRQHRAQRNLSSGLDGNYWDTQATGEPVTWDTYYGEWGKDVNLRREVLINTKNYA